jgi:arginase family enzyme
MTAIHLNLDDAWKLDAFPLEKIDARAWGPRLRFCAPSREIERFHQEVGTRLPPFVVYGSGDFHHLTALWLRRLSRLTTVVSFDNHPDWDIRPPRWCCGGWVNRALELPQINKVSVWGCGNFECWWPGRIFGNNRAERAGRLEVHPWADGRSRKQQGRRGAILRSDWREKFKRFVEQLEGAEVYVTVDLDGLRAEDAVTNWENGQFTLQDVARAIALLGQKSSIVAGDICGAWSPANYARLPQRFVSEMDHPKLPWRDPVEARRTNEIALGSLLPVLTQRNEHYAEADDDRSNR